MRHHWRGCVALRGEEGMKKILSRIVCFFRKRHTVSYMKANGTKFHAFYGHEKPMQYCVCPKCGAFCFIERGRKAE